MTILCADTLQNVLDLIESGASVAEVTGAIGGAPKSKIIFKWVADSAEAADLGLRPDASSPWCLTRGEKVEWFHILYEQAKEHGRKTRALHSPLRADLETRWAAKREQLATPDAKPSRVIVDHFVSAPVPVDPPSPPPPPPRARPSYAFHAKPLDTVNAEPPSDGRFSVVADRPKSVAERRAGTAEITETGVRRW